ncbi:TPA: 50S ribosomal protein L5, partial [Candidatus Micrarchaeota archaeon]|nr:50S ribosomal protein L5 [Candidatus Micrarchaeota archaeon]
TVNIGVGSPGERLDYAKQLISRLAGDRTPITTTARRREPVFKLRKGLPIGVKVTLRGKPASEFLEKAFAAKRKVINKRNFDREGNFSFGVAEYIDFPGVKYDPEIGMFGFDVCVTMKRRGKRVTQRKLRNAKLGNKHKISKDEAIAFVQDKFGVTVE